MQVRPAIQPMKKIIDKKTFGPWAIVTGASSGIGEGFARQLAFDGLNLILVARRKNVLEKLGTELSFRYGIEVRTIPTDLSDEDSVDELIEQIGHLEVGLLISNAGTGRAGKFINKSEGELRSLVQLNAVSHLLLVHFFGKKMASRKSGGILLTGAMGAVDGMPYLANESGTKSYVEALGKSLHVELKELGIHVTVMLTPPTATATYHKLGFTISNAPVKPASIEQCVEESLVGLIKNKATVLPGWKFRIMHALTPESLSREMTGKMIRRNNKLA